MYRVTVAGEDTPPIEFTSLLQMLEWMMRCPDSQPVNFLVEGVTKVSPIVLDARVINREKSQIEDDLSVYAPTTLVVGSRMTEDGYELVLEGPEDEIDEVFFFWSDPDSRQLLEPCQYPWIQ